MAVWPDGVETSYLTSGGIATKDGGVSWWLWLNVTRMFHVTLSGFPGFAPGPPEVSIVVEDHWGELAETVSRARFSPVRIAAGVDIGPVPHRSYAHEYRTPLTQVRYRIQEHLS